LKTYWKYIRKYKAPFILAPLFTLLEASGEFLLPYLNADLINRGAAARDISFILRQGRLMLLFAVFMLLFGTAGFGFAIYGTVKVTSDLRKDVFDRVIRFSYSDLDRFSTGSLITRITNDMVQVQDFMKQLMRGGMRAPVIMTGALVMSFYMAPRLAWIMLIVILVLAVTVFILIHLASPRYTRMQEAIDGMNTGIEEAITNEKVIKSFVRETLEAEKFGVLNRTLVDRTISALSIMLLIQPLSQLAIHIAVLAVVWRGGRLVIAGSLEIGTLTAFITYLTQMLTSLTVLANTILRGTRAASSNRRIMEVLGTKDEGLAAGIMAEGVTASEEKPAAGAHAEGMTASDEDLAACAEAEDAAVSPKDSHHTSDVQITEGKIEFRHVSFRYFSHNRENVLSDISFTALPGEVVGIVGSTGSGKTTLISLIPRLYDSWSGEILIDGTDIRRFPLGELRRGIAVVPQNTALFTGSVEENLRWGNPDASPEEMKEAASIACAGEFIDRFPDGFAHELGQSGRNLSGGQRQRLTIARAILKKPRILILDDATSACDTATEASIRSALSQKLSGVTKLVIAQRITSVMEADRILVLGDGRIQGMGTHTELMQTCAMYREIYASQVHTQAEG
jgi:ATP-binding cassette subfamily B multidrug efflux pump